MTANTKDTVAAKTAAARAAKAEDTEPKAAEPKAGPQMLVVHVIEDGFTAMGTVWYRGQEIRVSTGSDDFERLKDRKGGTFFDIADDEAEQIARYGKVVFRKGPWPHPKLTAEDIQRLETEANQSNDPEEAARLRKRAQRLATDIAPPGSN